MNITVQKCNNSLIHIWHGDGAALYIKKVFFKSQGLKPILNNDKKTVENLLRNQK